MPEEVVVTPAQPAPEAPAPVEPTQPTEGLTTEQPAAPEQPAELEQPAVPENYEDFVDPDGNVAFPVADMPDFVAAAKEAGLSQEKAQKLLSAMLPTVKSKISKTANDLVKTWSQQSKADPELGGDEATYQSNLKNKILPAYRKFATPELNDLLHRTGLYTNPEVQRLFLRIQNALSQDSGVTGRGTSTPQRRLFPNSGMIV